MQISKTEGLILDAKQLIKNANDNIENNIRVLCPDYVGLCAQNILSQLRNLIDAVALLKWYRDNCSEPCSNGGERTKKAIKHLKGSGLAFQPLINIYEYLEKKRHILPKTNLPLKFYLENMKTFY